ncbi:hypothetical protein ScPMuIL_018641 [Solemya velum]
MLSSYSSSGFYKAPVSQGLLVSTLASSVVLSFPLHIHQHLFTYSPNLIFDNNQVWRLLTSKLAFLDIKDLMISSLLIYYFRIFERRYGSQKFASYLFASFVLGTALEVLAIYVCRKTNFHLEPLPSGPLCIVYPFFVTYFSDIPRVAVGHVWGIPVTGKSLVYILGLQVASGSTESFMVGVCGITAGVLYRCNFLKVQSIIRVPVIFGKVCEKTLGHIFNPASPKLSGLPMGATLDLQRQEQMDQLEQRILWQSIQQQNPDLNNRPQPMNLVRGLGIFGNRFNGEDLRQRRDLGGQNRENRQLEPSEEQIQQLIEMGFDEARVQRALTISNNDISIATNVLLQDR